MGGVGYIDAIVGKVLTHAPEISAEPNEQQYAVCNDFGVIRRMHCFCPYVYRDGNMKMKNGKCQNNSWIAKLLHLFWNEIAL